VIPSSITALFSSSADRDRQARRSPNPGKPQASTKARRTDLGALATTPFFSQLKDAEDEEASDNEPKGCVGRRGSEEEMTRTPNQLKGDLISGRERKKKKTAGREEEKLNGPENAKLGRLEIETFLGVIEY